jgi:hypothetical protein
VSSARRLLYTRARSTRPGLSTSATSRSTSHSDRPGGPLVPAPARGTRWSWCRDAISRDGRLSLVCLVRPPPRLAHAQMMPCRHTAPHGYRSAFP